MHPRILEVGTPRLVEKFAVRTDPTDEAVLLLEPDDGDDYRLDRADARRLRDRLDEALTERREFLHTAGEYREDGGYAVSRRHADSAGHEKVFDEFAAVERLYERLPDRFGAADVEHVGVTGGRRHLLVRHFAEHPAFECRLVDRQPLTVRKADPTNAGKNSTNGAPSDDGPTPDGPGLR